MKEQTDHSRSQETLDNIGVQTPSEKAEGVWTAEEQQEAAEEGKYCPVFKKINLKLIFVKDRVRVSSSILFFKHISAARAAVCLIYQSYTGLSELLSSWLLRFNTVIYFNSEFIG